MPTKTTVSEKSRHSPLSMDLAIAKLLDASKLIACREGVSSNEEKRVQWAFDLLEKPPTGSLVRTMERRSHYRQFVRQAKKQGGLELVALCAAGLGQTSITAMRERDRLLLPSELSKYKDVYQSDVFHDIVKSYFAQKTASVGQSLTGEVYELTIMDAQSIVVSEHLRGKIYLTNTYNAGSQPFVTIPISRELSRRFATQRQQVM